MDSPSSAPLPPNRSAQPRPPPGVSARAYMSYEPSEVTEPSEVPEADLIVIDPLKSPVT